MNTRSLFAVALSATFLLSCPAFAHDPKLHKDSDEEPMCEAMQDMDHSKMDMDDPVMQAMMKKCADTHRTDGTDDGDQSDEDVPTDAHD